MAKSRGKRRPGRGAGQRKVPNDVQLSRSDLSQLDEGYLARLPKQQLRSLSMKLLADLKAAHDRLDHNPSNSSRPPRSRAPWESEDGGDPPEKPGRRAPAHDSQDGEQNTKQSPPDTGDDANPSDGSGQQRRAGRRVGAPGYGRMQRLPIDQAHHHHPDTCTACGAALSGAGTERLCRLSGDRSDAASIRAGRSGGVSEQTHLPRTRLRLRASQPRRAGALRR